VEYHRDTSIETNGNGFLGEISILLMEGVLHAQDIRIGILIFIMIFIFMLMILYEIWDI